MGNFKWRAALCGALWAALLLPPAPVSYAQPAPPVVRTPRVVPPASELAPPLLPPPSEPTLPERPAPPRELDKPEDDIRLDVSAYRVDDSAPPELREALAGLTEKYTGKQRGFEDLVNAANEVTRFLQRDLGYYLGYAYLPEQTPVDGVIRLAVLEGRLDRVVLNWRDDMPVDREVVEAYLSRLRPGDVLLVRDVERVVFLVNDLRGMTARFEVRSGSQPGTAALVVTPEPERVWSGEGEADMNGSEPTGLYRIGGLVQMNSPFGRGDGFTANLLSSTTGGLVFALLSYTTPVGSDGFKAGASISGVQYQLDEDDFPLDLAGDSYTANIFGLYPVVRSRNLNLFALASLDHKEYEDRQEAVGITARKTVDTVGLGATGDFRDSLLGGAVNTFDAALISGELKFPDGRNPALDDAERFTKLIYGYSRLQDMVTGRLLGYFSVRGQYTADNLDTTGQFRLGGPDAVRAFAVGEGTGDIGVVSTLELRYLPPESWFGRISREMAFSAFIDGGYVQYRSEPRVSSVPSAGKNHAVFSGAGLGWAWVRPNEYAARLSISKPIEGTSLSDDKQDSVRVYLQASMLFN